MFNLFHSNVAINQRWLKVSFNLRRRKGVIKFTKRPLYFILKVFLDRKKIYLPHLGHHCAGDWLSFLFNCLNSLIYSRQRNRLWLRSSMTNSL